jgi:hypothetical protein
MIAAVANWYSEKDIAAVLKQQTEEGRKERKRLYERTRAEILAANQSASENYDRALLTLSSGFLGGSLAFIEQVVGASVVHTAWLPLLYGSWILFGLTIILTLASFLYNLFKAPALDKAAWEYYVLQDEAAGKDPFKIQRKVLWLNLAYGLCFAAAVGALGLYIYRNLGEPPVAKDPKQNERAIPPATFQKPVPPASTTTETEPAPPVQPQQPDQQQPQKKSGQ